VSSVTVSISPSKASLGATDPSSSVVSVVLLESDTPSVGPETSSSMARGVLFSGLAHAVAKMDIATKISFTALQITPPRRNGNLSVNLCET